MSDADEKVFVCRRAKGIYHTNGDCPRLRGETKPGFTRELAESWGMRECSHCEGVQSPPEKEKTFRKQLIDADPADFAPTEFDVERGDA